MTARRTYQNGGNACTGALPTYEGALRKRPQAIVNEGTTNAFVTCSTSTEEMGASWPHHAYLRVRNYNAVAVSVTCTFVNGGDHEGSTTSVATHVVSANHFKIMDWGSSSPGSPKFARRTVSFSCNLPPRTGVVYVGKGWLEEIGN